jgi:peptidoglycan/LPS O-acetylase OafA/YrhL
MQLAYLALAASGFRPPAEPFWGGFSPAYLPANVLLVQATGLIPGGTWNFPSWSICIEFWTYLVFALACLVFRDRIGRAALLVALAAGLVLLLFSEDYMSVYEGLAIFRCIYGFFIGVAIHALIAARGLPGARLAARAELPALALAVVFIALSGKSAWTMLAPAVFGALIYVFSVEAGAVSRLLKTAPFLRLGAWSYSIYMVHAVILFGMKDAARVAERLTGWTLSVSSRFGDGDRQLLFIHDQWTTCLVVALFLALSIAMAALTYRLVEEPGRKFFSRLAARMDERAGLPRRRPLRPRIAAGSV